MHGMYSNKQLRRRFGRGVRRRGTYLPTHTGVFSPFYFYVVATFMYLLRCLPTHRFLSRFPSLVNNGEVSFLWTHELLGSSPCRYYLLRCRIAIEPSPLRIELQTLPLVHKSTGKLLELDHRGCFCAGTRPRGPPGLSASCPRPPPPCLPFKHRFSAPPRAPHGSVSSR